MLYLPEGVDAAAALAEAKTSKDGNSGYVWGRAL